MTNDKAAKRKRDAMENEDPGSNKAGPSKASVNQSAQQHPNLKGKNKAISTTGSKGNASKAKDTRPHKIRKLTPARPWPTVPTSASATGPWSARSEGKNYVCVTRNTKLGMYLRRCKEVVIKDGYKTIYFSALGAAVPHLLRLVVSLPAILPYSPEQVHTEVLTGTVDVHDEVVPDDEDEDISYQTRSKSTLYVVLKIGDGDPAPPEQREPSTIKVSKKVPRARQHAAGKQPQNGSIASASSSRPRAPISRTNSGNTSKQVVFQEPEQDDMDQAE